MSELVEGIDYAINDDILIIFKHVTVIPNRTFEGNNNFSKVVFLCDNLKEIGSYAFTKCNQLEEVVIPDTVTKIGDSAFMGCTSLSEVEFSDSLKIISNYAFDETDLTKIVLPKNIEIIGSNAFSYTRNNISLNCPPSLRVIGESAFEASHNIYINLNEGLQIIGIGALDSDKCSIRPNSLLFDGENFYNEESEISSDDEDKYTIENGVLYIHEGVTAVVDLSAAVSTNMLYKIVCPSTLRYMGRISSSDLREIVFNEGLVYIENQAFSESDKLKYVKVPSTIRYIGESAFKSYAGIIEVPNNCCYEDSPKYREIDFNTYARYSDLLENDRKELENLGLTYKQVEHNKSKIVKPPSNKFQLSAKNKLIHLLDDVYDFTSSKIENLEIMEHLILSGVIDVNSMKKSLLNIKDDSLNDLIVLFLKYGYDFNDKDLLFNAIRNNNYALVKILILMGTNIEVVDKNGKTPLLEAVACNNRFITKLLLDYGASINARTSDGRTALDLTINNNNYIIDLLSNNTPKDNEPMSDLDKLTIMLERKKP